MTTETTGQKIEDIVNEAEAIATPAAEITAAVTGNPIAATVAGAVQAADTVTEAGEAAAAAPKSTGVSVTEATVAAVAAVPQVAAHPQAANFLQEIFALVSTWIEKNPA